MNNYQQIENITAIQNIQEEEIYTSGNNAQHSDINNLDNIDIEDSKDDEGT
jgi:hypothetical protein